MDNERVREFCLALPHVTETVNWGHDLVFWVGDKAIGGKMFAAVDLNVASSEVLSFHCGEERFHELLEIEGIVPAAYSAKYFWVTVTRWDVLRQKQFEDELRNAHALILARLPKRTQTILAMPEKERSKIIRERKNVLAQQAKKK
jgi:predicted DNA-binding protein (MmcQ/YjbR family)